jgi:hypothetical protein
LQLSDSLDERRLISRPIRADFHGHATTLNRQGHRESQECSSCPCGHYDLATDCVDRVPVPWGMLCRPLQTRIDLPTQNESACRACPKKMRASLHRHSFQLTMVVVVHDRLRAKMPSNVTAV